jgi:hypothetical protein
MGLYDQPLHPKLARGGDECDDLSSLHATDTESAIPKRSSLR